MRVVLVVMSLSAANGPKVIIKWIWRWYCPTRRPGGTLSEFCALVSLTRVPVSLFVFSFFINPFFIPHCHNRRKVHTPTERSIRETQWRKLSAIIKLGLVFNLTTCFNYILAKSSDKNIFTCITVTHTHNRLISPWSNLVPGKKGPIQLGLEGAIVLTYR